MSELYDDEPMSEDELAATEVGVARIVAALRAAGSAAQTFHVLPELFDADDESAGRSTR